MNKFICQTDDIAAAANDFYMCMRVCILMHLHIIYCPLFCGAWQVKTYSSYRWLRCSVCVIVEIVVYGDNKNEMIFDSLLLREEQDGAVHRGHVDEKWLSYQVSCLGLRACIFSRWL